MDVVSKGGLELNTVQYGTALGSILHYLTRDCNTCFALIRKSDVQTFSELMYYLFIYLLVTYLMAQLAAQTKLYSADS